VRRLSLFSLLWFLISPGKLFLGKRLLLFHRTAVSRLKPAAFLRSSLSRLWGSLSQGTHFSSPFKFPLSVAALSALREKGPWNLVASYFLLKGGNVGPEALGLAMRGTNQEAGIVEGFYFHQHLQFEVFWARGNKFYQQVKNAKPKDK
jgi:hypothetical protein